MHAAEQLGYEPNQVARGFRHGRTMAIAFVMRDIAATAQVTAVQSAELRLRQAGYHLLVANSAGRPELDAQNVRAMRQRQVDGMLVSVSDERHAPTLAELRRSPFPIVTFDRELPAGIAAGDVRAAHEDSARLVVEHLRELGHRRVGLIAGDQRVQPARTLANGMIESCAALGIELAVLPGPYAERHGEHAAHELLDSEPRPTALVAAGSLILLGVLRALKERGVAIPRDVSVVSTDGLPELEWFAPAITAVEPPVGDLGVAAADLLLAAIGGATGHATRVLPSRFVVRSSTARVPR
jgi:LacI family transcriptional regulator